MLVLLSVEHFELCWIEMDSREGMALLFSPTGGPDCNKELLRCMSQGFVSSVFIGRLYRFAPSMLVIMAYLLLKGDERRLSGRLIACLA